MKLDCNEKELHVLEVSDSRGSTTVGSDFDECV